MHAGKKTFGTKLGEKKPAARLLRLLRPDAGAKAFLVSLEKTGREAEACKEAQKEIEDAMLEAESRRAKAIMTSQRHRTFC